MISQIGKGAYGVVYSVKNTKTNEIFAAKVYLDKNDNDDRGIQILNKEIKILKMCQHPSVVRFQKPILMTCQITHYFSNTVKMAH